MFCILFFNRTVKLVLFFSRILLRMLLRHKYIQFSSFFFSCFVIVNFGSDWNVPVWIFVVFGLCSWFADKLTILSALGIAEFYELIILRVPH
jgi:hypothetical protein